MADDRDDLQLFEGIEREEKEFNKDQEIDRVMKAFPLNAYEVLDLLPGVAENDIKRRYRHVSNNIHPDKSKNPQARDAFERVNKAYTALLDEKQRQQLDEAISDARNLLMRENKWTVDSPELKDDQFLKVELPEKARQVLMDDELRRRRQAKAQLREEGRQQRKEDEDIAERKRKREFQEEWEKTRDQRIGSWRQFQKGLKKGGEEGGKKKKQKMKVLG